MYGLGNPCVFYIPQKCSVPLFPVVVTCNTFINYGMYRIFISFLPEHVHNTFMHVIHLRMSIISACTRIAVEHFCVRP